MSFPTYRYVLALVWVGVALFGLGSRPAVAQDESPLPRVSMSTPVEVRVWNRPVVVLRAELDGVTPEERASRIEERIERIPDRLLDADVVAAPARIGALEGYLISVDQNILLGLVAEDLESDAGESLGEVANATAARIEGIFRARAEQQRIPLLVRAVASTLGAYRPLCSLGVGHRPVAPRASRTARIARGAKRCAPARSERLSVRLRSRGGARQATRRGRRPERGLSLGDLRAHPVPLHRALGEEPRSSSLGARHRSRRRRARAPCLVSSPFS